MKNVTVLFILFLSLSLKAQLIDVGLKTKIKNSTLIIEGEVIDQYCVKGSDGLIYTKSQISVSKKFKGNYLDDVPLYVLTLGGSYNGFEESWSHMLSLSIKEKGVFFLQNEKEFGKNTFKCFASSQGYYAFRENKLQLSAYSPLHSISNIDKDLYDIINNETKLSVEIASKGIVNDNCLQLTIMPNQIDRNISNFSLSVQAQMAKNPMYLESSKIRLRYLADEFGTQIVQDGNIEIYNGEYLPEEDYQILIRDIESGVLEIEILNIGDVKTLLDLFNKELFTINLFPLEEITYPFLLIEEEYSIENTLLKNSAGNTQNPDCVYIDIEIGENIKCPIITSFAPRSVAAGVNEMSLSNVDGTITIYGDNFCDPSQPESFVKPPLSDVEFWDVDLNNYFAAADLNYIYWTDDSIKLMVPTVQKERGMHPHNGATTHEIRITITDCDGSECSFESLEKLHVKFGMFNDFWKRNFENIITGGCDIPEVEDIEAFGGRRRSLVNQNGIGGYNLIIGNMFPNDSNKNDTARVQIIKALDLWRCTYGVNVNIVDEIEPFISDPNTCRITRSDSLSFNTGVTYMRVGSISDPCDSLQNFDTAIEKFDILINAKVLDGIQTADDGRRYRFNINETMTAADTVGAFDPTSTTVIRDLQGVMIHELGHAFQLRHTNNPEDIMASGRIIDDKLQRALSDNDKLGALHVEALDTIGACGHAGMTPFICESPNSVKQNIASTIPIEISPNPSTGRISITTKLFEHRCKISIVDISGVIVHEFNTIGNSNDIDVNLEKYNQGLYFIRITDIDDGYYSTQKFILN